MAPRDLDHVEFDEKDRWPRRLLHVPTMTSLKLQPGNQYGACKEPQYHAISYTWGRWHLKTNHFTSAEFEAVVREAFRPPPAHSEGKDEFESIPAAEDAVEFLWLDVACIDQRKTQEAYAEIGRQARIFRSAQRVYVWLSRLIAEALCSLNNDFMQATHATNRYFYFAVDPNSPENQDWPAKAEAFLSPKAFVLSKEAELICESRHQNCPLLLHYFFLRGEKLSSTAEECLASAKHADEANLRLLIELLNNSGFSALGQYNPMSILAVVCYRSASFELDRVYGIMQIFGDKYRVGRPRRNRQSADRDYTLSELEDELGALLLEMNPVLSQMHVYEQQPLFGKGWRMSNMSLVPHFATVPENYHENKSSSHRLEDIQPEDVSGMELKLEDLEFAQPIAMCTLSTRQHGSSLSGNLVELALDKNPALEDLPQHDYFDSVPIPDGTRPLRSHMVEHKIAACLAAKFRDRRLYMFLLGQKRYGDWTIEGEDKPRPDVYREMILLQNNRDDVCHWQRIGICRWSSYNVKLDAEESPDTDILLLKGTSWQPIEGLFV